MMDPLFINEWLKKHGSALKPPVGNKVLMENEQMLLMVVAGPNKRLDYHYNETPEFFFQLKGTLELRIQNQGQPETKWIKEGGLYLLDAKIPHLPIRHENSYGLVLEMKQNRGKDGLLWYCQNCNAPLFERYFELTDIEKDFPPVFKEFYGSENLRTCRECAAVHPIP